MYQGHLPQQCRHGCARQESASLEGVVLLWASSHCICPTCKTPIACETCVTLFVRTAASTQFSEGFECRLSVVVPELRSRQTLPRGSQKVVLPTSGPDQVLDTQLGDFGWGVRQLLEEMALRSSSRLESLQSLLTGAAGLDPNQAHAGHALVPSSTHMFAIACAKLASITRCYDGKTVPDAQYGFHVDNPYLRCGCIWKYQPAKQWRWEWVCCSCSSDLWSGSCFSLYD